MKKYESLQGFLEKQSNKEKDLKEKGVKQSQLESKKFSEFLKSRKFAFETVIMPTMRDLQTIFKDQNHDLKIVPESSKSTYELFWNSLEYHYFTILFESDPNEMGIRVIVKHISSPNLKLSNHFFPFKGFTAENQLTSENISQEITKGIKKYWDSI